jgi:SAM-dependent methyltransferase
MARQIRSPSAEFSPSTATIYQAVIKMIDQVFVDTGNGRHLDIGSGDGRLLKLISDSHRLRQSACDYSSRFMKRPNLHVDTVDLNHERLPYPDAQFDLVTCVETIEHLENFREVFREIYRVLRPGGWAVITTPNILNLRSRLRFLTFGFHNMFGPLAVRGQKVHDTHGHINPVGWFYLGHALLKAGFSDLKLDIDHFQRRSMIALTLLYLPIRFIGALALSRERRENIQSITPENEFLVREINTVDLLLGRTLIVAANKTRQRENGNGRDGAGAPVQKRLAIDELQG